MPHGATAHEPLTPAATPVLALRPATRSRAEALTLVGLFGTMLALRLAYAFSYPFDSDEPQHLHVAWAWTKGLLPYRDVFDNHAPLFHLASAPLVRLLGERADLVMLARLAMLPLVAATLCALYFTARRLFGARVALWSVAACWLCPSFVTASVEYRADVLWMLFWSLVLWALFARPPTRASSFLAGVFAGFACAASMKTVLLAAA